MVAHCQIREQIGKILSFDNSSGHGSFRGLCKRKRNNVFCRAFAFGERHGTAFDTIAQKESPVLLAYHTVQLFRSITDGVKSTDYRSHTGAYYIIDRNACFLDDFQCFDMCHSFGTTATEDNADLLPLFLRINRKR